MFMTKRFSLSTRSGAFLVAFATCVGIMNPMPDLAGEDFPTLTIPDGLGLNIHFTGEPRDLDRIAKAGFGYVRTGIRWGQVEQEKGVYEYGGTGYDALTAGCRERDIHILYILLGRNDLYDLGNRKGREAFAAFASKTAERYAGHGILWEVWNEPNHHRFGRIFDSMEQYLELTRQVARRVHKADPSGKVVAPATSGIALNWLEKAFEEGLLHRIDAVTVHPYRRHEPPESVIEDYRKLRALIQRYAPDGKSIPIISGEWGYPMIHWDDSRLTAGQQAQYFVRTYLVNLHQRVPLHIYYQWKNEATTGPNLGPNSGIVQRDLTPKPAYEAAATLTETLAGYRFVKRLDCGDPADFVLKFRKGQKEAVVFWTTGKENQALGAWAWENPSRGKKRKRIVLPLEPGSGRLVSMLGDREKALTWETKGVKCVISQSPRYLLLKGTR